MAQATDERRLCERLNRLEQLLQECEAAADSAWKTKTREIVASLLEFHGAGVASIVARLEDAGQAGREIQAAIEKDEAGRAVLLLYGLHSQDFQDRVAEALEQVRPLLASHGGNVELVECSPAGAVRLRLTGSCHGCASSQITLKHAIEAALYAAAPEIAELHVEGVVATGSADAGQAGFVPLSALGLVGDSPPPAPSPPVSRSR